MSVVDTSALCAIVFGEPDGAALFALMSAKASLQMSAATLAECFVVVEARQGLEAGRDLSELVSVLGITIVALDEEQGRAAVAGWRRFGKGRHPAALNFGDCFSYALAMTTGTDLLFKGHDFSQTDVSVR